MLQKIHLDFIQMILSSPRFILITFVKQYAPIFLVAANGFYPTMFTYKTASVMLMKIKSTDSMYVIYKKMF